MQIRCLDTSRHGGVTYEAGQEYEVHDEIGRRLTKDHPQRFEAVDAHVRVKAAPPVRKLAEELHVDIEKLVPSGKNGYVTAQDVHRAAYEAIQAEEA